MAIKIAGTTVIDNSRNITDVEDVGDANTVYYGDGSNLTGIGGGGASITVLTSNTTLSSGNVYMINASTAITLTLPASPSTGDAIDILNNTTISHTVARNGSTIQGLSENLIINQSGVKFKIWYTGSTWSLF